MLNLRTHRSRRPRPSAAMLIALIALFVSIGGVGYAATTIGTKQIENGAVTAQKLHNGAVTTKKIQNGAVRSPQVADGSLLAKDFKAGELPAGPKGPQGNTGPQGPQGNTGPQGPQGNPGAQTLSAAFNATAATGPSNIALSPTSRRCSLSPSRMGAMSSTPRSWRPITTLRPSRLCAARCSRTRARTRPAASTTTRSPCPPAARRRSPFRAS